MQFLQVCYLQVNAEYLEKKFEALSAKELLGFKDDLNRFFSKCSEYIVSDHMIRMINALQVRQTQFYSFSLIYHLAQS